MGASPLRNLASLSYHPLFGNWITIGIQDYFGDRIKFHSFKRPSAEMERSTVWLNAIFGVASTQFQKRSQKYNILPKKTTSSSAYDVRGMAGSLSVTTPWKEV